MSLSFEQIIAEAEETVARNKARVGKPAKAPVRAVEDPARENLYIPHRNVYHWYVTTCTKCGVTTNDFDGIYEERRHQRLGHTHWVRLTALPSNTLPRAEENKTVFVPYCKECAYATPEESLPESENPCHTPTGDNRQA